MRKYYSGDLPYNTIIIECLNEDHRYMIQPSQTQCFPFILKPPYTQVVIDLANTTPFENTFIHGLTCWGSSCAAGPSLTTSPSSSLTTINLPQCGVLWNFWSLEYANQQFLEPANINVPISTETVYWMNVQNLQNNVNYFWIRLTYHGVGVIYVE